MEPLGIVLSVFIINWWQITSLPYLPIKQKVRTWSLTDILMATSQMQNGLNSHCISLIYYYGLRLILDKFIVSLVHVNVVSYYMIRTSSAQKLTDRFDAWWWW